MDLNRTYSLSEATALLGMNPRTLQSWTSHVTGKGKVHGGGAKGRHRAFDFVALMEIAAVKALVDLGVTDLKRAFSAAAVFAQEETGPGGGWPDAHETRPALRQAGYPFPGIDWTLLVLTSGGAELIRATDLNSLHDAAFINISLLFARVVKELGGDPVEELRRAYQEKEEA